MPAADLPMLCSPTGRSIRWYWRFRAAGKVVVAAPVAGPSIAAELRKLADDVVILETPVTFHAVAQAYGNWYDVSDEEIIRLMDEYRQAAQRA